MNTPFYKNQKFQLLSVALCLLLFGCGKAADSNVAAQSASPIYAGPNIGNNDNNSIIADPSPTPIPSPTPAPSSIPSHTYVVSPAVLQALLKSGFGTFPQQSSCANSDLKLLWPLAGNESVDWALWSYFDQNPTSGTADYAGSTGNYSRSSDGSTGIDLALASFRKMDAGTPVYAASAGTVIFIQDGGFDRSYGQPQSTCDANNNYMILQHPNGFTTVYANLRKDSMAAFNVGDHVTMGQQIGYVGSSGCSSHPHLHFEVRNCQGKPIDPLLYGMFHSTILTLQSAPVYVAPFKLMDYSIQQGEATYGNIVDPSANIGVISKNKTMGISFSLAGILPGSTFRIQVIRSNGTTATDWTRTFTQMQTFVLGSIDAAVDNHPGFWIVMFYVNGVAVRSQLVQVIN